MLQGSVGSRDQVLGRVAVSNATINPPTEVAGSRKGIIGSIVRLGAGQYQFNLTEPVDWNKTTLVFIPEQASTGAGRVWTPVYTGPTELRILTGPVNVPNPFIPGENTTDVAAFRLSIRRED